MDLQDALNLEDLSAFEGGVSTAYSSPVAAMYGLNNAASASTVSPNDLLIRDLFSAPTSTTLTNLTSPSDYNASPEFNDDFDVSPNFGSNDYDTGSHDWYPLFPQESHPAAPVIDQSPAQKSDELDALDYVESNPAPQPRRKSGNSPGGCHGRHSSVSGVNPRRRDKPLPPIIVDNPADTVAMKRARNTLAARKSRERKAQKLEELEEKIAKLEEERDHWKRLAMGRSGSS